MAAPSCRIIIAFGIRFLSSWKTPKQRLEGLHQSHIHGNQVETTGEDACSRHMLGFIRTSCCVWKYLFPAQSDLRGPDRILEYSCTLCEQRNRRDQRCQLHRDLYLHGKKQCVPCRGYQLLQRYGVPFSKYTNRRIAGYAKYRHALLLRCQDTRKPQVLTVCNELIFGHLSFGCILGTDRILQRPLWQQRRESLIYGESV